MEIQHTYIQPNRGLTPQNVVSDSSRNNVRDDVALSQSSSTEVGRHSSTVIDAMVQKMKAEMDQSEKVARLKEQVASGQFEVNTTKIADQLIFGERIALMSEQ